MKNLRKQLKTISLMMSFLILFVSCNQHDVLPIDNIRKTAKYSGEDIFKGLFFFQNDIAKNISQLSDVYEIINETRKNNNELNLYLQELSSFTISFINERYPDFFTKFQEIMYSENFYDIENYLITSTKIIEQAVLTSKKYSSIYKVGKKIGENEKLLNEIKLLDLTTDDGLKKLNILLSETGDFEDIEGRAVAFAAVVAGVYLLAGAINTVIAAYYVIAAAAVVVKVAFWDPLQKDGNRLSNEILVAELGVYFSKN